MPVGEFHSQLNLSDTETAEYTSTYVGENDRHRLRTVPARLTLDKEVVHFAAACACHPAIFLTSTASRSMPLSKKNKLKEEE